MKIFLSSDIHVERAAKNFDPFKDYECLRFQYPKNADVVVLAGDVGEWTNGLEWSAQKFKGKQIIYIMGNHELYDLDLSVIDEMQTKAKELKIHLLDQDEVIIDGVRFLGCTLWTDLNKYKPETVAEIWQYMNDYKYISCKGWWQNKQNKAQALWLMNLETEYGFDPIYFSPTVAYLLHKMCLHWLDNKLKQNFCGKTVVVTHHAPTMHGTDDYAYGSDLSEFISKHSDKVDCWMHGHIHTPVDYNISNVRIVSNPRGYPPLGISSNFDERKIISL